MTNLINISTLLEFGYIIPNSNEPFVLERVETIISKNERQIVEDILGVFMTGVLYSELEQTPPTDRSNELWNGVIVSNFRFRGIKVAVMDLLYVLILKDKLTHVSANGIMGSVSENSEVVNPNPIINAFFNQFVEKRNDAKVFLLRNTDWENEWDASNFIYIDKRSDYNF